MDDTLSLDEVVAQRDAALEKADEYKRVMRSMFTADREYLIAAGTMRQRQRYHDLARLMKADILEHRRVLGRAYIDARAREIDPDVAVFRLKDHGGAHAFDLSHHAAVQAAVAEAAGYVAQAEAAGRTFPTKDSLDFVGSSNGPFDHQSAIFALATHPLIVIPVIRHLGVMPILTGYGVTLARNEQFFRKSSQRLHLDPEDRTQVKVFVYITDVDENSGPFMAASAEASSHLFEEANFILDRQDDTVVEDGSITTFTGPAGTTIFCDTCRCLHAGARPGDRRRIMLSMEYNLPTYLWAPLFPGDGLVRDRMRAVQPDLDGLDEFMRPLLGRNLIA